MMFIAQDALKEYKDYNYLHCQQHVYHIISDTADFIIKVLGVYTSSMETINLSLSAQVAKSTFFMKSPVGVRPVL